MITVSNVTKRYGATVAVDGLDFDVRAGEVTGFLGPNGRFAADALAALAVGGLLLRRRDG